MRKLGLFFLLVTTLFIFSCSDDNNDSPVIQLISIEVNDSIEYRGVNTTEIPPLTAEGRINIQLRLRGEKNELRSFYVFVDEDNASHITTEITGEEKDISEDPNFTKPEEGYIGFVDAIKDTRVNVRVSINEVKTDKMMLSFYLSTSTTGGESDKMELIFSLATAPQ